MASTDEAGEAQEEVVTYFGGEKIVTYFGLPTVEQCREFMAIINAGRKAAGLDPVDTLEFDDCDPGNHSDCLSAHHLVAPLGGDVGGTQFMFVIDFDQREERKVIIERVAAAIGSRVMRDTDRSIYGVRREVGVRIPGAIKRVTDPFDRETPGLRDRLVEAGVVAA